MLLIVCIAQFTKNRSKKKKLITFHVLIDASTLNTYVLTYDTMKYNRQENELRNNDYGRLMTTFTLLFVQSSLYKIVTTFIIIC